MMNSKHVGISPDYHWTVTLETGDEIHEEYADGTETVWGSFPLAQVTRVTLVPHRNDLPPVTVNVPLGYFVRVTRRTRVRVMLLSGKSALQRATLVGVGPTEAEANWIAVGPDGWVYMSTNLQDFE